MMPNGNDLKNVKILPGAEAPGVRGCHAGRRSAGTCGLRTGLAWWDKTWPH